MPRPRGAISWPAREHERLHVLSLSFGVQSWTLACLYALYDPQTPPFHFAACADTGYEREATYAFMRTAIPFLEDHGLPVHVVGQRHPVFNAKGHTGVPFFIEKDGRHAQMRRQCTHQWKLRPIYTLLRQKLKEAGYPKKPGSIQMHLGISTDEWTRAKDSRVRWVENQFPLLDRRWSRTDCLTYLKAHHLPIPPKSSCVFCPYAKREHYQNLSDSDLTVARHIETQARIAQTIPLYLHWTLKSVDELAHKEIPPANGQEPREEDAQEEGCIEGYCFL